eukprot:TRINITY_DN1661_c3_g1_i1.p1 TRINITY_DN1661_c3_g1~~TRINITY_DN1661_c3_g1_i1.p1  ORF type:complete len:209 (+),score=71.87 TRINITY_DN1661_c3_g1_i1:81-707(+)
MGQHTGDEATPVTGTVAPAYGAHVQGVEGVQGVPVSGDRVVVIEEVGRDDYLPACLSTALCGPFGLCATWLCCPTQYGKLGAASGCAWNTLWRASLMIAALILVAVNVINCDQSLTPDMISRSECLEHNGNFTDGGCYDWCPEGFDIQRTERDNFTQWCEDPDPTCTGLSRSSMTINIVVSLIIFFVAVSYMRKYARDIQENPEYRTV